MSSVLLADVVRGARARRVSLASESAGYLTLAAADQMSGLARRIDPEQVEIDADGSIRVTGGAACDETGAEAALRALLELLLSVSSGPSVSLSRVAQRAAQGVTKKLVTELEAALIPVNRSAARRALKRLERETRAFVELGEAKESVVLARRGHESHTIRHQEPKVEAVAPVAAPAPVAALAPRAMVESAPVESVAAAEAFAIEIDVAVDWEVDAKTPAEPAILRAKLAKLRPVAGEPTPFLGSLAWLAGVAPVDVTPAEMDEARTDPVPTCMEESEPPASSESERPSAGSAHQDAATKPPKSTRSRSDISELVAAFRVGSERSDRDLSKDLRRIAGLDVTPLPPGLSRTPPPVTAEAKPVPSTKLEPIVPKRTLIIGVAAVALCAVWLGGAELPAARLPAAELGAADCTGTIRVNGGSAQSVTIVRELPSFVTVGKAEGANPRFTELSCDRDYEVLIRDARRTGSSSGALGLAQKLPVSGALLRATAGSRRHEVILAAR